MKSRLLSVCLMAMMGVLLVVSKEVLAFLPNVEILTLLIILFTLVFRKLVIGALSVFLLLEGLLYGFGIWWIMYLYIWPLLALLVWLFRWMKRPWQWAVFAGLYGLAFGALCSLVYWSMWSFPAIIGWIAAGFLFDCNHAAFNFLLCLFLYRPLRTGLEQLQRQITTNKRIQ